MKIIFEKGDMFMLSLETGFGIVLSDTQALIITEGGRSGYKTKKDVIPRDARLCDGTMPLEVKFALDAVKCAIE